MTWTIWQDAIMISSFFIINIHIPTFFVCLNTLTGISEAYHQSFYHLSSEDNQSDTLQSDEEDKIAKLVFK